MELGPKQKIWVEALRSGQYKQGRDFLCQDNHYCCLGVANDVFNLQETSNSYLEDTFREIGLKTCHGSFILDDNVSEFPGYLSLASMNDKGCSFLEIADAIEKYSDLLFSKSI